MDKKFTALRIIGTIYKIVGVLIALGTVLTVIVMIIAAAAGGSMMSQMGFDSAIWVLVGIILTFIGGGLSALSVFAIGEALYLLINLEENTRFSAMILRDRFYPQPPPPQPMMPQRPMETPPPLHG